MQDLNILEYGARPDGVTNNAAAIQAAVDAASAAGGGRVVIPAGRFLSGSVMLKSNVELHLQSGAVLLSSLRPEDIRPFRSADADDDMDGWNGGFFLGACGEHNVTISGPGTINGQGDKVFFDRNEDNGFHECPKAVAEFRPRMMLFENITDFTVCDVTLKDAAFWTLHMAGCKRVRIRDIRILNDDRGANNDGIDPDCCQDVVISGCIVHTGDDAIVVKATGPMTRRYGPSRNITITNCVLHSRDSALKIGTETWGNIQNITFGDCVVDNCSRAVGIWVRDGGTVENIRIHHLTGAVRRYADRYAVPGAPGWWGKGEPVFINATRRAGRDNFPGVIRHIGIDHLTLTGESCVFIAGEEYCPVEDIQLEALDLTMERQGTQPGGLFDEQPSARHLYEHEIPALYARSVRGLRVKDCRFRARGKNQWCGQLTSLENCPDARVEMEEVKE